MDSLPQSELHVVASGRNDREGEGVDADGGQVDSTDRPPRQGQPDVTLVPAFIERTFLSWPSTTALTRVGSWMNRSSGLFVCTVLEVSIHLLGARFGCE